MAKAKMHTYSKPYARLLQRICVGLGYCGSVVDGEPRHVDGFIPDEGPVTADQFVEWVFRAEGLDPTLGERAHQHAIREAFIEHMGADIVDAAQLR